MIFTCTVSAARWRTRPSAELDKELPVHRTLHAGLPPDAMRRTIELLLGSGGASNHCYSCGPLPLMKLVEDKGAAAGWPQERKRFEYFKVAGPTKAGDMRFEATHAAAAQVPADRSIVEVALVDAAIDSN